MGSTMDDLIAQVPDGQTRIFEPVVTADREADRFLLVMQDHKYNPHLMVWKNPRAGSTTPYDGIPTTGSYRVTRRGLDLHDEYVMNYSGAPSRLVDFYAPSPDLRLFSEKLFALFQEFDPGAIEHRPARVVTRDGELSFHAVLPSRVIEAVDVGASRTAIERVELIPGEFYQTEIWFPDGPVFRSDIPSNVHALKDRHYDIFWYWSIELIEEAQRRGVRGLYARYLATARRDPIFL